MELTNDNNARATLAHPHAADTVLAQRREVQAAELLHAHPRFTFAQYAHASASAGDLALCEVQP